MSDEPSGLEPGSLLPMTALDLHVLLVLAAEDLYGYAIMKAVEAQSGGVVTVEIGSLYRVLARLLELELVAETDAPEDAPESHRGRPRKYYRLTALGLAAARAEVRRLNRVVGLAGELLPGTGRT